MTASVRRAGCCVLAVLAGMGAGVPAVAAAAGTSGPPAPPPPTLPVPSQPIFVSGPPPGALKLLNAVSSDEGQFVSLAAITEAHTLLHQAQAAQARAGLALDKAAAAWDEAQLRLEDDEAAKLVAEGRVSFVDQALGQLGLAEYTGVASVPASNLQSQEKAEDHAELANVAASTTANTLSRAQAALASDRARERGDGAVAARAWRRVAMARSRLIATGAQVALSTRDVTIAHKWAVQTGSSPLYPTATLLHMEGRLGRTVLAQARRQERLLRASGVTAGTGQPPSAATTTSLTATTAPTLTTAPSAAGATTTKAQATPGAMPNPIVPGLNLGGPQAPAVEGPSILGPSLLSEQQIVGWFESTGAQAHITTSVPQLVWDYLQAGRATGVRADLTFAQSIVETGHFVFPPRGQLTKKDNNFAGIGACDTCKTGWRFPSAMAGVMAQERLLQAYATPVGMGSDVSSMAGGVRGCCTTWLSLSGVWATNPNYGYEILGIYKEMLDFAIPKTLLDDGLITEAQYQRDELELPAEDARTYALVAEAIQQSSPVPVGTSCPAPGKKAKAAAGAKASQAGGSPSGTATGTATTGTSTTGTSASTTSTSLAPGQGAGGHGAGTGTQSCSSSAGGPAVPSSTTTTGTATATTTTAPHAP